MKLKVSQIYSQRDTRWASQLLGYNTNPVYNIGLYGCLITCFGMYVDETPEAVNYTLIQGNGYVSGGGNFIWSKSTLLGVTQTYLSPRYEDAVSSQGITKIKEFLDGGFPLVCEIDFNPNTSGEEMHYILLCGYEGDKIFAYDPWTGQLIDLDLYGGPARCIIQFRAYDKVLPKDDVVDPLRACMDKRDSHWNDLMAIKNLLLVTGDYVLKPILDRIDSLMTTEIAYGKQAEALRLANEKITKLEEQIKQIQPAHDQVVQDVQTVATTVQDQGQAIKDVSTGIQEVRDTLKKPEWGAWQTIWEGIKKLFGWR